MLRIVIYNAICATKNSRRHEVQIIPGAVLVEIIVVLPVFTVVDVVFTVVVAEMILGLDTDSK